jgi:hypothetical protein
VGVYGDAVPPEASEWGWVRYFPRQVSQMAQFPAEGAVRYEAAVLLLSFLWQGLTGLDTFRALIEQPPSRRYSGSASAITYRKRARIVL